MADVVDIPAVALDELFSVPEFYPIEFSGRYAHFVRMNRDAYKRSIFADSHRVKPIDEVIYRVEIPHLISLYQASERHSARLNFLFHNAHCGSTLVARAIDLPEHNIVIREPGVLRQLAVDHARTVNPPGIDSMWGQGLRLVFRLLGRRYDSAQPVIVKANVPVNFILQELTSICPDTRTVILYSGLEDFMLAALKSPSRRQWVKRLLKELADGVSATTGIEADKLALLADAPGAAILWLAQMKCFHESLNSQKAQILYSESFFNKPTEEIGKLFDWFGHSMSERNVREIVDGGLFAAHAKAPQIRYDNASRKAEKAALLEQMGGEIRSGISWLKHLQGVDDIATLFPRVAAD